MAGKSGSGQVFTSPKSTNISQSNANCASRHKNYPFNHSSSYTPHHNITTGAGATHHHQTHPHLYSNFTPSSSSPSFPTSSSFSHLRPHSPSKLSSSRINSSSSLSSSFNYNSPLSKSGTPAPSPGAFVSPLASIGKINYSAPGTCSMFYKNALKKKKKKNSSSSTRENRNRDSSPVHPSALVSYLRGERHLHVACLCLKRCALIFETDRGKEKFIKHRERPCVCVKIILIFLSPRLTSSRLRRRLRQRRLRSSGPVDGVHG